MTQKFKSNGAVPVIAMRREGEEQHDEGNGDTLREIRDTANEKIQIFINMQREFGRLGDTLDDENHKRFADAIWRKRI